MGSSISHPISLSTAWDIKLLVGSIWQCIPRIRSATVWSEARISQKTSLPRELNSHLYCVHAAKLLQVSGTMVKARWESRNLTSHARIRKFVIHLSWWCKNRQVLEKDNMRQQILSVLRKSSWPTRRYHLPLSPPGMPDDNNEMHESTCEPTTDSYHTIHEWG